MWVSLIFAIAGLKHADVTIVTAKTVTNVGPRFEWYPLAVRDDAFFHALISSTSSHAAYMQKVELPRNFYFHRGEAIRIVNERLANGAHDEGTINAIAVFAQQEVGIPLHWFYHTNGVELGRSSSDLFGSSERHAAISAGCRRHAVSHIERQDTATCIPVSNQLTLPIT